MEELQLALTAMRVEQKNFGLWLKSWQVGQMLQALIRDEEFDGAAYDRNYPDHMKNTIY